MISTTVVSRTGERKCAPTRRAPAQRPSASASTGRAEVVEASMAVAGHTCDSAPRTARFAVRSSATASTAMSTSWKSSRARTTRTCRRGSPTSPADGPDARRRSRRRRAAARNTSPASGRRTARVSGTPRSASSSASPPPIRPSPTMPTRPLLKRDLAPDDACDQVDQLSERLDGVAAGEARQLARVDGHLVLPLELLEQGEEEERIEAEIVEQVRFVAHLRDVSLELVGEEAFHLGAHLRPLHVARRTGNGRAALVGHDSSCGVYPGGAAPALTTRLAARSQSKALATAVRMGWVMLCPRTCPGGRQSGSSSSQFMVGGTRPCAAASRQAITWSTPDAAAASPSIDLIALMRTREASAAKSCRRAMASARSPS